MIPNPIFYNDNAIMTGLIVCCLVVLAVVMVPKAIRHRKQVKQNTSEKPTPDEEQELQMIVVPPDKSKLPFSYKDTFLSTPKIIDRQTVFISKDTRDSLAKIARQLGDRKMSVSGFLENMANHHLEEYADEINRLYKE